MLCDGWAVCIIGSALEEGAGAWAGAGVCAGMALTALTALAHSEDVIPAPCAFRR